LGRFEEFKTFFHGHTYTANPLGCAAAIANLEIFKKEKVLAQLPAKIKHMQRELSRLWDIACVGDIRQKGFMVGIELVKNRETKEDFPEKLKIGARVCAAARHHGLLIRPLGNILVFMPPLSITENEITFMINTVRRAIAEAV
jgi:adenosylmethionine-8-amino-7-oxononanoate aminotransferase